MEHETVAPEFLEKSRPRLGGPSAQTAEHEISPAEQNAIRGTSGAPAGALQSSTVIGLQRTAGNTAVTALLQRSLTSVEDEEARSPVLDVVGRGRGQALDEGLREDMEARFGDDFSDVRIHADAEASRSAAAVSARAYTVGREIVLGADVPDLATEPGKRTLAHELTHVIQQRQGPVEGTPTGNGISVSDPSDRFERAAEANAERVMGENTDGAAARRVNGGGVGTVAPAPTQREVDLDEQAEEMREEAESLEEGAAEIEEEAAEGEGESEE
jgi:Domain of unknown function (DUF4157)